MVTERTEGGHYGHPHILLCIIQRLDQGLYRPRVADAAECNGTLVPDTGVRVLEGLNDLGDGPALADDPKGLYGAAADKGVAVPR
jgi:hypothetical protein